VAAASADQYNPPTTNRRQAVASEFRTDDWDKYRMEYSRPHVALESAAAEIAVVDRALAALVAAGILPDARYDTAKFLAHRSAVAERFEIPWTGITPRMQRLLYAINAILRPEVMLAAGVFCGNTFISNAGAAIGPGACYAAKRLIGVEIKPDEAARARRNVALVDPAGVAEIVADDAVAVAAGMQDKINLLYLDADGAGAKGKGVYLDILEAAWDKLPAGAVILAHNSVNCAGALKFYLAHVRDQSHCRASVNIILDGEGLEVSLK
jgi:predicted O-methyltransferase YrrM